MKAITNSTRQKLTKILTQQRNVQIKKKYFALYLNETLDGMTKKQNRIQVQNELLMYKDY